MKIKYFYITLIYGKINAIQRTALFVWTTFDVAKYLDIFAHLFYILYLIVRLNTIFLSRITIT